MNRQPTPPPPGWYPDQADSSLVRFWDGRQWTDRTSAAYPSASSASTVAPVGAAPGPWRRLRLRTKVLLVVGALVVFGALVPGEDAALDARAGKPAQSSAPESSTAADPAEAITEGAVVDDDELGEAVAEEPEESEEPVIEEIAVPALRSKSIAQARSALRRVGLEAEVVRQPSWQPTGQVLKQGAKAGSALLAGAVVTLVVAAPMPRVPGVLGKGAAIGQAALARAGFKVTVVKQDVSSGADNVVISQTPAATQQAAPGSVVRLVVSNFVAPPPPPKPSPVPLASNCTSGYSPCLAPAPDYDCAGGSGDGPRYTGLVQVTGSDPYDLDSDGDGWACES